MTNYTITSLMAFTNYSVTIKAWTAVGAGPASSQITQITAQAGE